MFLRFVSLITAMPEGAWALEQWPTQTHGDRNHSRVCRRERYGDGVPLQTRPFGVRRGPLKRRVVPFKLMQHGTVANEQHAHGNRATRLLTRVQAT